MLARDVTIDDINAEFCRHGSEIIGYCVTILHGHWRDMLKKYLLYLFNKRASQAVN